MTDPRIPRRHRWIGWAVGVVASLLIISIGWVVVRGVGAVNDLQQVAKSAAQLRAAIGAKDIAAATPIADRIAHHAKSANDLTSDPIWRGFEIVPWLGPNFAAVREIAEVANGVCADALEPVLAVANDLDLASLGFSNGGIDLTPFPVIEVPLAKASKALDAAHAQALHIDADATLPVLADAVHEMRNVVTETATVIGTLHGAAVLLPTMLGGEGPRYYVVAMQNNAELRSTGGILGAVALLSADNGKLSLVTQASVADFPKLAEPLPLDEATLALFGDGPGRYIQNATSIPDFVEAGPTIAARWQAQFGGQIDGVVAIDAIVAEHLVAATGPITIAGITAAEDNIVSILLSEIYALVPDPLVQDAVFAQAASALFGAALSDAEPQQLLTALAASAAENRLRIWSAHEDEQSRLAASTLGGALPTDSDDGTYVGVLINDTTGGKMDYYTEAAIETSVGVCGDVPTTQVEVTWTSNAPADAATSLPPYVTANGFYGVPVGSVRTLIAVYGPEGALPSRIDRDGTAEGVKTALIGARTAIQHEVLLAPGESTTITVQFVGTGAGEKLTKVKHTPTIKEPKITQSQLRCDE